MKIAIFGGTFNPVTKGHISLGKFAINQLQLDKLFLVPTNKTPLKKVEYLAENFHRIKMLEKVSLSKMIISPFETNQNGVSYSIKTVEYFKQKFPQSELFVLVGSDNVSNLNKWKQIQRITSLAQIVVFRRSDKFKHINLKKYKCLVLNNPILNYASSEFKKNNMDMVNSQVLNYIAKNHLYLKDILKNNVDEKRYLHCLATGEFAAKLAKQNGEDAKLAYLGGLMHDLTKNWSIAKHRKYLLSKKIDESQFPDFKLHSKTASVFLEKDYKLQEPKIISAICKHTSLDKKMSLFDKIIFASDKLCQGRKRPGIQKDRNLIFKNFDEGFKNLLKINYDQLVKSDKFIDKETKSVYQFLINN